MKRFRFAWIDDVSQKVADYQSALEGGIQGKATATLETIVVSTNILDALAAWCEKRANRPPHLIIIDHVFLLSLPFGVKGSSLAHLLRNQLTSTPIVCVTSMLERPDAFDQEDLSEYTAVISYPDLESHLEFLYALATDFRKLVPNNLSVREHIVSALRAPSRDKADLLRVLPEEFQNPKKRTTGHRIAYWLYNVLMGRAGFLYDSLETATLLGLTESGFHKVRELFRDALYKGPLATESKARWWVSEVRRILYERAPKDAPETPQLAGRLLPELKEDDFSMCYVTRTKIPPPDAVVFADATRAAARYAVRREFAEKHPNDPGILPGFEARLVLSKKGAR